MDKLSTKHFMFFIFGTSIVTLKTYPSLLIQSGGRETWVIFILASILIFFYYISIINTCKKLNTYDITEIYRKALGKYLGTFFISLFYFNIFLSVVESSSLEANSMHTNMFIETPIWYLQLLFIIPAIYTLTKNLNAIKICTLIGLIFIFLAGINLVILSAKYKQYKLLFPIFPEGINISHITTLIKVLGGYGSIAISLPYLKFVEDKTHLKKHSIIAVIIVIQMEIISIMGVISSFGDARASTIFYPKLIQTQLISYFGFLESGEFFVMLQMVGGWFVKYIIAFYILLLFLKEIFIDYKNSTIFIVSSIVFAISFLVAKNDLFLFKILNYYLYISSFNYILIPLIIVAIIRLRGLKQPNK